MDKQEKHIFVFKTAVKFLWGIKAGYSELSDAVFKSNFESEQKFNTLEDACRRLFSSLQNRSMMPSVIKFENKERKEKMSEILFGYNPRMILKEYTSFDSKLVNAFERAFGPIANIKSKRNLWRQFSQGIISGSKFMSSFKDKSDFDGFTQTFNHNKYTKAALPMLLSKEIKGLGFALACDFLKELGYRDYPKPDVHLIDIFFQLGLSESKEPYEVYKSIIEMSEVVDKEKIEIMPELKTDAYVIDKVFWLIGSGKIFNSNKSIGGNRKKFIAGTKRMMTIR